MSYDINQYAFVGIPITEITIHIPSDETVILHPTGTIVAIDDKFKNRYEKIRTSHPGILKIGLDEAFQNGYHRNGNVEGGEISFVKFFLLCAGVNSNLLEDASYTDFSSLFGKLKFHPFKELIHLVENHRIDTKCDYVTVQDEFLSLVVKHEYKNGRLSVCDGYSFYDQVTGEQNYNFIVHLKSSLESLVFKHLEEGNNRSGGRPGHGHEYWIGKLLDKHLAEYGISVETEIVSTRFGDVHRFGGMTCDLPYLVFGSMCDYDEDGWDDPREDEDAMKEMNLIEELIFGEEKDNKLGFKKYTPQFGG